MSELDSTNTQGLVVLIDGDPATTTLIVAHETDNEHRAVLQLIRTHVADFEEFGRVAFEMRPLQTAGGVQQQSYANLNEEQAALLVTYLRNNEKVRIFKKRIIRAFFEMRKALTQRTVPPLQGPELLAHAVLEAQTMIAAKDATIKELTAPARSWQLLADASGDFSVAEAAKILSRDPSITTGRDRLFDYMAESGWIFRAKNARGGWEAYQTQVDCGRLVERPAKPFLNSKTGQYELPAPTIRVTAKGIGKLHELMGGTGELQLVTGVSA